MWQVKTQFSQPMKGGYSSELEWGSVTVDTQEEAEDWWKLRVSARTGQRRVVTMTDPAGNVVRVKFI